MSYYLDDDGEPIDKQTWRIWSKDHSYAIRRAYLNDLFRVTVQWLGGPFTEKTPHQHAANFALHVSNIITTTPSTLHPNGERKEVRDPDASGYYRTLDEAVNAYEHFLVAHCGCEWLSENHFVERGNKLTPLSPDAPSMDLGQEALPTEAGSW